MTTYKQLMEKLKDIGSRLEIIELNQKISLQYAIFAFGLTVAVAGITFNYVPGLRDTFVPILYELLGFSILLFTGINISGLKKELKQLTKKEVKSNWMIYYWIIAASLIIIMTIISFTRNS